MDKFCSETIQAPYISYAVRLFICIGVFLFVLSVRRRAKAASPDRLTNIIVPPLSWSAGHPLFLSFMS